MSKKKIEKLCIGVTTAVVLSAAGLKFIKEDIAKDEEKDKTEQVIKDMSMQGIPVVKKGAKGAPDSVLTSVEMPRMAFSNEDYYINPKYKAEESGKTKIKLGEKTLRVVLNPKEAARYIDFKIQTLLEESNLPEDSVKNEIKRLKKAKENLREGTEVDGVIISDPAFGHYRAVQTFEHEEDDWGKPTKQANKDKTGQMIKDMSMQGISVVKKGAKNAPDSVLSQVDIYNGWVYSGAKYKARDSEDIQSVKPGDKKVKSFISIEQANQLIDVAIETLSGRGLPESKAKAEIKKLEEARKNLKVGSEIFGETIGENANTHTIQKFEYDKETPWGYAEPKDTSKSGKSGGANWSYNIEVREIASVARLVVEFHTNSVENMMELIRKNCEGRNMHTGELDLSEGAKSKVNDNTFGKIEKATAKVRRHGEEFSGSLGFKNPNEQQVAAKQQRAPKKKSSRRMNRDALPGRTLANMKANKGRKD